MRRIISRDLLPTIVTLIATLGAQARDLDVGSWRGDFGELAQRLGRCGQYSDYSKLNATDYRREAELLVAHGYIPEGILNLESLLEWNEDFKKEPFATDIHSRVEQLRSQAAREGQKSAVFNAVLAQLDVPKAACHITETDLPQVYRQDGEDKRLEGFPSFPRDVSKSLATNCPILEHRSLYRFWRSEDHSTQAAVIYDFLGPFAVISTDGGKSWGEPLYLGLHRLPDFTYMILDDSKLPLVERDNILLEVTVWNRDRSKPGGPLMGYQYHWKKWNRMLRIPIATVSLDTDGDGLSDLFEERILTNPRSKDTDGDHIDDASDSQPLHPFPGKITVQDEIFLALLCEKTNRTAYFFDDLGSRLMDLTAFDDKLDQSRLTDAGVRHYTEPSAGAISPLKTTFIDAERDTLTHITGNQRFIVLNDAARNRYKQKFGDERDPNYATFTVIVNPDGTKALVKIAYHQRGESFALEKKQERWSIQSLGSIIWD